MNSRFAKKHLESLGWQDGQGLGREKQGISDAIRPELKMDQAGLGHVAEEFGFAWWDHCFNKAAKKIQVSHCEKSGEVKVKAEKVSVETKLANKRAPKDLLYGSFVAAKKEGEVSDGKTDEHDDSKDHSTLSKLTDEEIYKRCGGRTAHKGARHGIRQVAKLKRAKEDKLLKSIGHDVDSGVAHSDHQDSSDDDKDEDQEKVKSKKQKEKKKKSEKSEKKSKKKKEKTSNDESKKKKSTKKSKKSTISESDGSGKDDSEKDKSKRKKRKAEEALTEEATKTEKRLKKDKSSSKKESKKNKNKKSSKN